MDILYLQMFVLHYHFKVYLLQKSRDYAIECLVIALCVEEIPANAAVDELHALSSLQLGSGEYLHHSRPQSLLRRNRFNGPVSILNRSALEVDLPTGVLSISIACCRL